MLALVAPPWEPAGRLAGLELVTLADFPDLPETIEDAPDFAGNARKKASEAARGTGLWTVADDSGLTVDALDDAPGVLSARYAGTHGDDLANNRKLLEALADVPDQRRGAAFMCALALADPAGAIRFETIAACRGRILREARGRNGFGYDPLFLVPEYHQTFGELSSLVKHQLSHRSRAFTRLRPTLERLL
jgi:XTP/dITP diphosphohydrolase